MSEPGFGGFVLLSLCEQRLRMLGSEVEWAETTSPWTNCRGSRLAGFLAKAGILGFG